MFNIITQELKFSENKKFAGNKIFGGNEITLEYGKFARQADSSVMVSCGNTKILCTVVFQKGAEVVNSFFPLTVAYMERYHAVGKIPGGFIKRETKPSEGEILTSRLIDRTIRPMFDENFLNEVQVACTVFSYEVGCKNLEFLSLLGAVATLRTTSIPFYETVVGVPVGFINGDFVINDTEEKARKSKLDMFVSSTKNSILMVESEANELTEEQMVSGIQFAMEQNSIFIDFIDEFAGKVNGLKNVNPLELNIQDIKHIEAKMNEVFGSRIADAFSVVDKKERNTLLGVIKDEINVMFITPELEPKVIKQYDQAFKNLEKNIVRQRILKENKRIDGRTNVNIRPIEAEVSILPSGVHGSALFTRGETQALASITLGAEKEAQMVDTMSRGLDYDRFMLHYNFPGFSVGEVARFGAPGRREIGHGNLAKKALNPMLPSIDEFSYAIRAISDILESNGSSSMATVCGVSLALQSANVPMKKLVSGIAMGLIKEGDEFVVLSDILGDEDHLGDMDFKVAGTESGITALQMDIKIRGITLEIIQTALQQAKDGRAHIMNIMQKAVLNAPKREAKAAPAVKTITVPEGAIRLVIGQGGSVIKDLCQRTGANIDIAKQGGVIKISALEKESVDLAIKLIESIVNPPKEERPELDTGAIYPGIVKKIFDGYILVRLDNGANGNVYGYDISYSRFDRIEDVFMVGERVKAKVLSARDGEEVKLSLKFVDQENGKDVSALYNKEAN